MKSTRILFAFVMASVLNATAEPIHVLVWDERQPRQAEAYDNFLGNEIAKRLGDSAGDIEIRSVGIDDAEQGLAAENLDWADVLIWWGHVRQDDISVEQSLDIVARIKEGRLALIALHSAHLANPSVEAMNERIRPGHELYPVYKQEQPLSIISNAVYWLGKPIAK